MMNPKLLLPLAILLSSANIANAQSSPISLPILDASGEASSLEIEISLEDFLAKSPDTHTTGETVGKVIMLKTMWDGCNVTAITRLKNIPDETETDPDVVSYIVVAQTPKFIWKAPKNGIYACETGSFQADYDIPLKWNLSLK